jgi:hypothetical protein
MGMATNLLYLQYLGECRHKLIKNLHKYVYNDLNSALQLLQTCLLETEMQLVSLHTIQYKAN